MADSIINTIGLSVVDAGLQLAQLGTLTDPFSLPNHESYYITLQVWVTDPYTGQRTIPLMTHTFTVMPQQMRILKQYLSKVIATPGGTFVDDFHTGDPQVIGPYPITLSGNFGKKARIFNVDKLIKFDGSVDQVQRLVGGLFTDAPSALPLDLITGYGQIKFLERLCDLSHMPIGKLLEYVRNDLGLAGRLAYYPSLMESAANPIESTATLETVLYNWSFHQFVVVNINSVQFTRNPQLKCWSYALNMVAIASALSDHSGSLAVPGAVTSLLRGAVQSIGSATVDAATQLINAPINTADLGISSL